MENNKNNIPEEEEKKKNKDIEIVTGDGSDLNISHVYDHITLEKQEKKNNEEIIIPKEKKNK
ncbi:MAG: hypothetical protein ILA02_04470 [Clostridia bacterium]|nr:hypothetical protein [Clostridia bacterium]